MFLSTSRGEASWRADFTPRTRLMGFEVGNEFSTGKVSASGGTENNKSR
jgi:hypothetical protein